MNTSVTKLQFRDILKTEEDIPRSLTSEYVAKARSYPSFTVRHKNNGNLRVRIDCVKRQHIRYENIVFNIYY
jgi:hypothetical protein